MCMDCDNENVAFCLAHIETCSEVDCKLCAVINREIADGTFYMSPAEKLFNSGMYF